MLRTLAINSNQIVLSFGVLIAFLSPKQFKNEGELYIVHGKAFGSSNSWRTKLWSSIALFQSRSKYARKEQRREEKQSEENRGQQLQSSFPLLKHFPKSIFYMIYTISKLRKSRIQRFKRCAIRSWNERVTAIASRSLQVEGRIVHSAVKSPFCCEMISQPFLSVCEISQTPFSLAKWFLEHPDICYRHWEIFSIRFLLSKSQNTPCKPPITWFLSF